MQSCSVFNPVNIALGREYVAKRIDQSTAWLTAGPSGKFGIGMIILVPQIYFPKPNSLQRERVLGVGIYENPEDNWNPDVGTMLGGDDWADNVVDFMWNWHLLRSGGLVLEDHVTVEDNQHAKKGIIGTIVLARLRQERKQTTRCAAPVMSADGGRNVTLTVTDGSAIWYTTDGESAPSPKTDGSLPGEQAATLYKAPFLVDANTVVLAAAFAENFLPSQTTALTVT